MTINTIEQDQPEIFPGFHQSIIDSIADPIMIIDRHYRIILLNHAAQNFAIDEKLNSRPQYCYQLSHHLLAPCNGATCPCPLKQVLNNGQPVTTIHEHCQANGEMRMVEVHAAPLINPDGTLLGIIESMRDITERYQTEQALRKSTERLRALTSQLAEVSEIERKRLSQELHDRVGQNLTVLGINLNIIRTEISASVPDQLLSRLDDSLSLVEQTTQHIRDVMANLRPPVLDDYGLVAALKWCGKRFGKRTNIVISVKGQEPSPRLRPRQENVLFRIAQEALTNVAKHSQASLVDVTVEEKAGTITLQIADDGVGFNSAETEASEENKGWGIITMMERAEAEGGHCHIVSQPGLGTRVITEINR